LSPGLRLQGSKIYHLRISSINFELKKQIDYFFAALDKKISFEFFESKNSMHYL